MRAVIILVYLVLILCRGYARTDVTIHDKLVCTSQSIKQGGPHHSLATLTAIEAEENDDNDIAKKFKLTSVSSKFSHTIVVSHLYKCFHNRLPVYYPVPYRYLLLSKLRI